MGPFITLELREYNSIKEMKKMLEELTIITYSRKCGDIDNQTIAKVSKSDIKKIIETRIGFSVDELEIEEEE